MFLDQIARIASGAMFFFIGIHEGSPLRPLLEKQPHISYGSKAYLVAWDDQFHALEQVERERIMYLECGML